jgi:hypothetical protein
MTRVRSGKGAGFALSFVVVLAYWLIFTSAPSRPARARTRHRRLLGRNGAIAIWAVFAYARLEVVRLTGGSRASELAPPSQGAARAAGDGESDAVARHGAPFPLSAVLDRYVGMLYVRMLALALAATYLVFSLIELKGSSIRRRAAAVPRDDLFVLQVLPAGALVLTLPFAAMIGAVVAVTLLARTGEITADQGVRNELAPAVPSDPGGDRAELRRSVPRPGPHRSGDEPPAQAEKGPHPGPQPPNLRKSLRRTMDVR